MAKELTEELSVAEQISPSDMAELAAQGFRSVICNRPDGEGSDQPLFAEIAAAATAAGLEARYIPVATGRVTDGTRRHSARPLPSCRSPSSPTAVAVLARRRCGRFPKPGIARRRTSSSARVSPVTTSPA